MNKNNIPRIGSTWRAKRYRPLLCEVTDRFEEGDGILFQMMSSPRFVFRNYEYLSALNTLPNYPWYETAEGLYLDYDRVYDEK